MKKNNIQKAAIFIGLALVITFIYHNWLPNHKIEFSGSYLLHFITDSIFTGFLLLITWEVNLRVNSWLDKYYKWEIHPFKRLAFQISLNTIHSFLLISIIVAAYSFILAQVLPKNVRDIQVSGAYPVLKNATLAFVIIFLLYQVTYIGVYFFRQWTNSLLESERLKRENLYSQLQALQVQVNPHFLFNSLSSLVSLIEEDKNLAIKFVEELANVYRYLLQQKNEHLVRVSDEMNFINSYIYLHKARCGNSLKAEINIDKRFSNYLLPPQTIQILVENAIKHNIISSAKPLTIRFYTNKDLYLTVENNLQKKISVQKGTGTGLQNIRERYQLLSKRNIQIEISDEIYKVAIPIINPEEVNESFNN